MAARTQLKMHNRPNEILDRLIHIFLLELVRSSYEDIKWDSDISILSLKFRFGIVGYVIQGGRARPRCGKAVVIILARICKSCHFPCSSMP